MDSRGGYRASSRSLGPVWWQMWWRATFSQALFKRASLSLCVCRVEGGWGGEGATMRGKDSERENVKENVRELRGILTHYGCVEGWGCDRDEYIIACPLVSSHQKYNRWNWWTVSIEFWHFTSRSVQLSFIMCSQECIIQQCRQKIKLQAAFELCDPQQLYYC